MERLLTAAHSICKGAFHDVASTTIYRGHAGPKLFACNTSLLHPRSIGLCPLLQQVTRVVGSGTDSCLSGLSDQRKEAGGSFDQRCHLRASLPLSRVLNKNWCMADMIPAPKVPQ